MKVLVTGGTGFLGRSVVPQLVGRGAEVVVMTRHPADSPVEGVTYVQGDLASLAEVTYVVQTHGPESLVHLAWSGLPDYASQVCLQNLELGLNTYRAVLAGGVRTLVTVGSCWEYDQRRGALREGDTTGGSSPFAAVKSALRMVGQSLAAECAARFYWLRCFFVYGPGQRSGALIPSTLAAARCGAVPGVQTPEYRHDFVHVADVARAVADVWEQRPAESLFNVGSGVSTAVADVVRSVYRALHLLPPVLPERNMGPQAPQDYWADTQRIRNGVGWVPQVELAAGIQSVIESRVVEAA